jgi:hypothetical protein
MKAKTTKDRIFLIFSPPKGPFLLLFFVYLFSILTTPSQEIPGGFCA